MGIRQFLASQLRQPHGWFGSLVMSRLLDRGNRKIVNGTLSLLDLRPEHDVLEIGFGGGFALGQLLDKWHARTVTGVDLSPEMVARAERRFRRTIAAGRLRVRLGDVSRVPAPDASFDRVFTINTIYFWRDTREGLDEIRRVLRGEGLAAVSIRSKERMERSSVTRYDFRLFSPEELADSMRQAGFREIRIDHRDRDKLYDQVIIVGRR